MIVAIILLSVLSALGVIGTIWGPRGATYDLRGFVVEEGLIYLSPEDLSQAWTDEDERSFRLHVGDVTPF